MHQTGIIYSIYYGGFIQCFQLALSVKRVNGDPVKKGYQDHDIHLRDLYLACLRYRLHNFTLTLSSEDMTALDNESAIQFMVRLEEKYSSYVEEWENTDHEPSKLVSLFLKATGEYCISREGPRDRLAARKLCLLCPMTAVTKTSKPFGRFG